MRENHEEPGRIRHIQLLKNPLTKSKKKVKQIFSNNHYDIPIEVQHCPRYIWNNCNNAKGKGMIKPKPRSQIISTLLENRGFIGLFLKKSSYKKFLELNFRFFDVKKKLHKKI